jgi:hypothetical protein
MLPAPVAAFRAQYRTSEIGPRYSGWGHFAFTSLTSLAIVAVTLAGLRGPSWLALSTVPITFLFANAIEYLGHRKAMHRLQPGLGLVYRRHTVQHHHFFTHEAMSYEGTRDFKMVLFPPIMIVFFFGLFALPVGAVLWALTSPDVARLYVATAVGYFLCYEWLHFAHHLRPDSPLGRLSFLRTLRQHHQDHHDPSLMGKYNFNITFPICDLVAGTLHRRSASAE